MFNLSEAASLGLHAGAYLAGSGGDGATTTRLAGALGVSETHLAKVLRRLGRAGVVSGRRGPGGGYRLARPAASVTLLELYEAIEGSLEPPGCLLGRSSCLGKTCVMGSLLHDLDARAREHLSTTTLADVALGEACR